MTNSQRSDTELLTSWVENRQERDFRCLVERYAGLVHVAALRRCGDASLAEEVSQLTFITLASKAKSLISRPSLAAWLHVTAMMHAKNELRRRSRETRKRNLLQNHMETTPHTLSSEEWGRINPALDEALSALPEKDRETLLLRFYRSFSVREIAEALGVSTDAAQKRLNRATERLRLHLARRGYPAGTALAAALAFGLGADAKASVPGVSAISAKAIASAAAPTGAISLTSLTLIIMTKTKSTAIIVTAALALAGVIAVSQTQKKNPGPDPSQAQEESTPAMLAESNAAGMTRKSEGELRKRAEAEYPDLVAKYGESRTNLSKHVARQLIGLQEETIKTREMLGSAQRDTNVFAVNSLGTVGEELELNEQQQDNVAALYNDYEKREQEQTRDTISSLKKDSTELMEILLSCDSFDRGEITEEQHREVLQTAFNENHESFLSQLGGGNPVGSNPLKDDVFRVEFAKTLEPIQVEKLTAALAELDARVAKEAEQNDPSTMTELPAMSLEELDEMVQSATKATVGLRSMMEGINRHQELDQDIDQQE